MINLYQAKLNSHFSEVSSTMAPLVNTCPIENQATGQPDRRSLLLSIIESIDNLSNPDSNSCPSLNMDTVEDVIATLKSIASSSDFCLSNNEDKHSKGRRKRGVNLTSNHSHNPRSNTQALQVQQTHSKNSQQLHN